MRCLSMLLLALVPGLVRAQDAPRPAELLAEVQALRADRPPWRELAWRSCLLDGVAEARRSERPLVLWVFIDRPVDDARC